MCQKNDYARRTITVLLAVLTALFVFGATISQAQIVTGGTPADGSVSVSKLRITVGAAIVSTILENPLELAAGAQAPAVAP